MSTHRPTAPVAAPAPRTPHRRLRPGPRTLQTLGLLIVLLGWQLVSALWFTRPGGRPGAVPPPLQVLERTLVDLGQAQFWSAMGATASSAAAGFGIGVGLALVIGTVVVLVPVTEGLASTIGVVAACAPVAAVAPVVVLLSPVSSRNVSVALAVLAVAFPTIVGTLLGLRAASPAQLDLIRAYGGDGWMAVRKVRLVNCLPAVLASWRIAAPSAVLGAIVGEFFAVGVDTGLGRVLISLQYSGDYVGMWAAALLATLTSAAGYGVVVGLSRVVAPWTANREAPGTTGLGRPGLARRLSSVGALLLVVLVWQLALPAQGLSTYLAKTPVDVVRYLLVDDPTLQVVSARTRRDDLWDLVVVTVRQAAFGLLVGAGLAFVGAVLLASSTVVRTMFLPVAMFLQTVPLIALAPVIYAVFGSGLTTVAVICGVVSFFPLLVNLDAGFASAGVQAQDVVTVFGGGRWALLRHVALPASLPFLFAALRIAAPATVGGGMLYEYLFTFEGLGAGVLTSKNYSQFGLLWTIVAVSVALALLVHTAVSLVERVVLSRRLPGAVG